MAQSPRGERRGWQFGPRIRIGGTLGKIGQKVKIGAGKVLSNDLVDTGLALIPGVGPGIAAAAKMSGKVLDTSNGGLHGMQGVGDLAKAGVTGYADGMAGNAVRGGIQTIANKGIVDGGKQILAAKAKQAIANPAGLPGGAGPVAADASDGGDTGRDDGAEEVGSGSSGPPTGNTPGAQGGDMVGDINKYLKDHGVDVSSIGNFVGGHGKDILAGAEGVNAAVLNQKAIENAKNALGSVTESYNQRAPLRVAGISGMLDPKTADLSSLTANSGPYGANLPPIRPAPVSSYAQQQAQAILPKGA